MWMCLQCFHWTLRFQSVPASCQPQGDNEDNCCQACSVSDGMKGNCSLHKCTVVNETEIQIDGCYSRWYSVYIYISSKSTSIVSVGMRGVHTMCSANSLKLFDKFNVCRIWNVTRSTGFCRNCVNMKYLKYFTRWTFYFWKNCDCAVSQNQKTMFVRWCWCWCLYVGRVVGTHGMYDQLSFLQ